MKTFIDIETIPTQAEGALERIQEELSENFKAPSDMSKTAAIKDLVEHFGINPESQEWKYKNKAETLVAWVDLMKPIMLESVIDEEYRKTALDSAKGEICVISAKVKDSETFTILRDPFDEDSLSERQLLINFFALLKSKLTGRPPYFIGHNIGNFDLKFIYHRAVINSVLPLVKIPYTGSHGKHYYDTMVAWTGYRKDFISQQALADILGFPGKPDDVDGSKVWDFVKAGNVAKVAEYCSFDVDVSEKMYNRLEFKHLEALPEVDYDEYW